MKIIAVATIKGGVGKTVVSAHLAAALGRQGRKTLLVDLDPQGHATALSGVRAHPDSVCTGDALMRDSALTLDDAIVHDVRFNLDVAPATLRMASQERQLYTWALRLRSVLRALQSLRNKPEAVVMDCAPYVGGYTEAALHAADLTIAPIPALAGAAKGFEDLRTTWKEMRDGRSGDIAAVVNLWDERTSRTNTTFMSRLQESDVPLLQARIPKAELVNQAALEKRLVFDYAPNHSVTKAFDDLAAEAWERAHSGTRVFSNMDETDEATRWAPTIVEAGIGGWSVGSEAYLADGTYSVIQR